MPQSIRIEQGVRYQAPSDKVAAKADPSGSSRETKGAQGSAVGRCTLLDPTFGDRGFASQSTSGPPTGFSSARRGGDEPAAKVDRASQDFSRELYKLLERLPGLAGEDRDKAKAEFLEIAAKSAGTATELIAKSAHVAERVTGRVKSEWANGRERAESLVHANPLRTVSVALGIGVVLGASLFGSSRQSGSR